MATEKFGGKLRDNLALYCPSSPQATAGHYQDCAKGAQGPS